jgi:hypothetical protein
MVQTDPRSDKIKTPPEFVGLKERFVEEIRTEALEVAAHTWVEEGEEKN